MTRKAVIESSEHGRIEIDYSAMTLPEIKERIRAYEKKYGQPLSAYNRQFNCGSASPQEMLDIMDWETLVQERADRRKTTPSYGR